MNSKNYRSQLPVIEEKTAFAANKLMTDLHSALLDSGLNVSDIHGNARKFQPRRSTRSTRQRNSASTPLYTIKGEITPYDKRNFEARIRIVKGGKAVSTDLFKVPRELLLGE